MRRLYWPEVKEVLDQFLEWEKENPFGELKDFADSIGKPLSMIYSLFDRLRLRLELTYLLQNRLKPYQQKSPRLADYLRPDPTDKAKAEALL